METDFSDSTYSLVKDFRTLLISNVNEDKNEKKNYIDEEYSLEKQLIKNNKDTSKIDYTISGIFYLDGFQSSVRTVFPLNSVFKLESDNPNLVLNLKERNFIPISGLQYGKIYLNEVERLDKYGNVIEDSTSKSNVMINTDDFISEYGTKYVTNYVHKYLVSSEKSRPEYETDSEGNFVNENIKFTANNELIFKVERAEIKEKNNITWSNFFIGPYLKDNVAYRKWHNDSSFEIKNVSSPLNFYTSFRGVIYNLYDIINGKINETSFDDLSEIDKVFYDNYIKSKRKQIDYLNESNTNGMYEFKVDLISEKTSDYEPEQHIEDAKFAGLKYQSTKSR